MASQLGLARVRFPLIVTLHRALEQRRMANSTGARGVKSADGLLTGTRLTDELS